MHEGPQNGGGPRCCSLDATNYHLLDRETMADVEEQKQQTNNENQLQTSHFTKYTTAGCPLFLAAHAHI
jgi:hypothetical protein